MTYGHAYHQNPSPGGHEIYNFDRPFLGHHYFILSLPPARTAQKATSEHASNAIFYGTLP